MDVPHQLSATPMIQALLGLLLLVLGRKLFWVFVGIVGFFFGLHFGQELLKGQPELFVLVAAVAIGLVGALLAIFLERLAVAIAGGAAGGLLALKLVTLLGLTDSMSQTVGFFVGAIVAALLVSALLDWALIVLSALTGAVMAVEPFHLTQPVELLAFVVLAVVGIMVQARQLRGEGAAGT